MFFFDGCKCPFCGEEFKKEDDVVACPVCGTPHHRECYKSNGVCAFESEHADGYVWQRKEKPAGTQASPEQTAGGNICPQCGASNQPDRLWCEKCSSPLGRNPAGQRSMNSESVQESGQTSGGTWQSDNGYFSFGGEASLPDNELIDDVPAGDLRRFVKGSSYYYIPLFAAFSRLGRKVSLNIIAFFTHGLWFISRKMYLLGSIVLAVQAAIHAFQSYCYIELEDLMNMYYEGDMAGAYSIMADLMVERPVIVYGMMASAVLRYAILFGSGLFANWLYKEHCVRKVKKLNARSANAEEFNAALESNGGTAIPLAIGCGVLFYAVMVFLQYIIQG